MQNKGGKVLPFAEQAKDSKAGLLNNAQMNPQAMMMQAMMSKF